MRLIAHAKNKTRYYIPLAGLFSVIIFYALWNAQHSGFTDSESDTHKAQTSEVFTQSKDGESKTPAVLIDEGTYSKNGQFEIDFWMSEKDIDFSRLGTLSRHFSAILNTRGTEVHDIVISVFELDQNSQPINEKTFTCKEQSLTPRGECSFSQHEGRVTEVSYTGTREVRATLQFSQFIKDERGSLVHRSTWIL